MSVDGPGDFPDYTSPPHRDTVYSQMRILINTPTAQDLYGDVSEFHYNGADDSIYIRGTDAQGGAGRERRYFSGEYSTVSFVPPDIAQATPTPAPQAKTMPPSTTTP